MIEEAIVALLTADPTVAGLIAARLYPVVLPEDGDPTKPAAAYQVVSDIPDYTLDDGSSQKARVQLTAWAPTALAAKQLTAAIRAVLEEYSGTAGGCAIANAWVASGPLSQYEQAMRRHRVQTDFFFLYSPAS